LLKSLRLGFNLVAIIPLNRESTYTIACPTLGNRKPPQPKNYLVT